MSLTPPGQLVRGVLSPFERWAEVLFGLIMALTITGALSVARATEEDTRAMFFSALACNVAWGLVDGVMYVLNSLFERGRRSLVARALRSSTEDPQVAEILSHVLPTPFVGALGSIELQALRRKVLAHPELPERPRVHLTDLVGAAGVFLLVTASTFPVALPFLLLHDPVLAMRVSRAAALVLLFLSGFAAGRYAGLPAVTVGLSMLGIGAVLVAVVTALGG